MSRVLRVPVTIDDTGWLSHGVELRFARNSDGTIQPRDVRVGPDALVEDIIEYGDVFGRSTRYNRAIGRLRRLRELLNDLIRRCEILVEVDSTVWPAHQALLGLDQMIVLRQSLSMGHGIVRVATLDLEIEYLQRHHAHLAVIVASVAKGLSDGTSIAPTTSERGARRAPAVKHKHPDDRDEQG
jgi:hypothetical protein